MDNVNKTLYIPLYGKAYVSQRGLFLNDPQAEAIWAAEGFALKGKSKSKWLAFYMGIRAAVFDEWVKRQLTDRQDAVVLHLGCGMDSRALRTGDAQHTWYDVDFPAVTDERRRYYSESATYRMIAADVREKDWLTDIPETSCAVVVMEGVSMYLTTDDLQALLRRLCGHFERVVLLLDAYTPLAAKLSKHKNPINDVGVTEVCGLDDPKRLECGGLVLVRECEMTPKRYVDELRGVRKFIFKTLYAGRFAKALYRLYEYTKEPLP